MSGTPQSPGAQNWALILFLGVVWGTAFMGVELALRGISPLWVAAGRTVVAALVLVAAGRAFGQGLGTVPGRGWGFAAAIGVASAALPFTLLSWGQQHVPSAFAGVSMGAVPLMVVLLVMLFSPEEGVGPRRIAGIGLGFAGLAVLIGPGAFAGAGELTGWGRMACVAAAGSYAAGNVLTRRAPPVPPIALATAALLIAAAILVPVALLVEGIPAWPDPGPMGALLWIALGPTALAALIQVRVVQSAGSLFMSLVSYMVPVWSVIFGVALLGEEPGPRLYMALGLILSGIGLSQWSAARRA